MEDDAIDECARVVSALADNVQELKLCMGEMTAQELRTLRSGLRLAAHKVRLLKFPARASEAADADTNGQLFG